jgi:hypothetical protein
MKCLILENDDSLSKDLNRYIDEHVPDKKIIFEASGHDSKDLLDSFKEHQILLFQPTLITFSQYNLMMMMIYKLLKTNENGIKEIHIFHYDENIGNSLKELWDGKRMYLDEVIKHIKIFRVSNLSEKQELHI